MLTFQSAFSLSYFTFIKRLFSSSSVSAIRLVASAYLRLLVFPLEVFIPACGNGGLVAKSCLILGTPCTGVCQAPLSIEFSRQEYWSGLPFPSPGDLTDPGMEPGSPELQADSLPSEPKLAFNLTNTNLNSHSPTYYLFYLGQVT